MHLKFPLRSLRTPPITEQDSFGFTEASTFHLSVLRLGESQTIWILEAGPLLLLESQPSQSKYDGFLMTSFGEYGNFSFHPVIHHPIRSNMRSFSSLTVEEDSLNTREFLSFHNVHTIIKKIAAYTFLKNGDFCWHYHWTKASRNVQGKTHTIFHWLSHHDHSWRAREQCIRRWSLVSGCHSHRAHTLQSCAINPIEASLLLVLILPINAIQTNTSILCGTNPFHTPLTASWCRGGCNLSNSSVKDLVEKLPDLVKAHMCWSWAWWDGQTCDNVVSRLAFSSTSRGLRALLQLKLHTQFNPSQKPWDATVA